ncbi:Phosphoinositide 3-kinase regulatory subunit 4 [Thelohanellus kitauei]|uniref:non-specific serine/threonine protein kinase n=1 Tax=Thelohanellus kitauei TaxID=669202 RepID=A0A0C2IA91_THEKT|nr:Phosphoinositide 3-kinase regulatory subunit 4 [Thelohanellus kitauei]
MGNTLSNQTSQLVSSDVLINDVKGVEFVESMSTNRFMKTMLVNYKKDESPKDKDQLCVAKIFVRSGVQNQILTYFVHQLEQNFKYLKNFPFVNVCTEVFITEKICVGLRPYLHANAYDRMSTRPYLTEGEKIWFIFQMLQILQHIHPRVVHGDIKLENFLVTSWDFLILSDFSIPIKPATLQSEMLNNEFNYFFDTSGRHSCYISPERITQKKSRSLFEIQSIVELESIDATEKSQLADEKPSPLIDIFSLGCVIYQFLTDGKVLFRLTDLLAYSKDKLEGHHFKNSIRQNIQHEQLCNLIISMISLDPDDRLSARQYINNRLLFPDSFHMLYNFSIKIVRTETCAEYVIYCVKNELDQLIKSFQNDKVVFAEHPGYLFIINLCNASCIKIKIRQLKEYYFEIMLHVSQYVCSGVILNRILPHFMFFMSDSSIHIRCLALEYIIKILASVQRLESIDESNLFSDYILPNIQKLISDSSIEVRSSLSRNLKNICDEAFRFHSMACAFISSGGIESPECLKESLSYELASIYSTIQRISIMLLSDPSPVVQCEYITHSFGSIYQRLYSILPFEMGQRENMISHAIAVLNNYEDWCLRTSFFDVLPIFYSVDGISCLSHIMPILFQGLQDNCEWVIQSTIKCIIYVIQHQNSFPQSMTEVIKACFVFIIHPVPSIRKLIIDLIFVLRSKVDELFFRVDINPWITKFIKPCNYSKYIYLYDRKHFMIILPPYVPSKIFWSLVSRPGSKEFFDYLESHDKSDNFEIKNLTGSEEYSYFINLLDKYRFSSISQIRSLILMKDYILSYKKESPISLNFAFNALLNKKTNVSSSLRSLKEENYKNFVDLNPDLSFLSLRSEAFSVVNVLTEAQSILTNRFCTFLGDIDNESLCGLENLTKKYSNAFEAYIYSKKHLKTHNSIVIDALNKQNDGTLKLLANFRPHNSYISRVVPFEGMPYFITAGHDCSVMIWNSEQFDVSKFKVNFNPVYIYNQMSGKVSSIKNLNIKDDEQNFHRVACASFEDSDIQIFDIFFNSDSSGRRPFHRCVVDHNIDGFVVDLSSNNIYSNPLLLAATLNRSVLGYDLRAFSRRPSIRFASATQGYFTALECDPFGCWVAAGTDGGCVLLWDYRFPSTTVNDFHTCCKSSISRLQVCCTDFKKIICGFQDSCSPVGIYLLDSGKKVVSFTIQSNEMVSCTGLQNININNSLHVLFSCTDGTIRDWNVESPKSSSILVKTMKEPKKNHKTIYSIRPGFSSYVETRESTIIDSQTSKPIHKNRFDRMATYFTDIAYIPSTRLLLAGTIDGFVHIYK